MNLAGNENLTDDYGRTFYIRLVAVVFLYINFYSLLYYFLGAKFTFLMLLFLAWFLAPILLWFEFNQYPKASRLIFMIMISLSIVSPSLGVREDFGVEYYFLAAILIPVVLYNPDQKKYIILGELMPLFGWLYQTWGLKPQLPAEWMPKNFPAQELLPVNFIGSFIVIAIIIKLFVHRYQKSLHYSMNLTQRQEFILDGASLGAWDWWPNDNRVVFDKRWCEMIGLDYQTTVSNFVTWESRVHPEDKKFTLDAIKNFIENPTTNYQNIHRLRHENGSWVWILVRGKISEFDSNNRPYRFTGTHYNITYLKELESLQENVQNLAKIGGWELEIKTGKTKWTNECYKIHNIPIGTPTDTILGISFFALHEREKIKRYVEECIKGVSYRDTFEFIDNEGQLKWVEVTGTPIYDVNGNIYKLQGTIQDVTKQISAEKLLEESQTVAKLGSWSFDLVTNQIYWSRQLYDIYQLDQRLGPPLLEAIKKLIHPEDIMRWNDQVNKCVEMGHPYRLRYRSYTGSGSLIWLEIYGAAKFDDRGNVISLSGTIQDITELAKAEEEAKLERMKATQNAKLASLGEMSAGIAHEINNPLSIITANVKMLHRYLNDPEKLLHKLTVLEKASNRISKIVNGLRKFSRSAEKNNYHVYVLANLIREAVELTAGNSQRLEFELTLELNSEAKVLCNEIEIEQVFINLINNGMDANKSNEHKWLKLSLEESEHFLIFRITDSGSGIPEDIQAKIFEPFFTTKAIGEGTGLGLSIVKGILDDHRSTIEILPNTANTTFELKFPIAYG